ncbi:MAG: hypothetical protein NTZ67_03070 [Gammaproteobacteria bacterium]|nr:hypothetical protein [Gammaproteobacteria bacterium]
MQNTFTPATSKLRLIYLILTHLFAMSCVCSLTLPPELSIFFIFSFSYYLTAKERIIWLRHDKKTEWALQFSDTEYAILLGSSIMLPHLLILNFKLLGDSKRKTIILFSDCFSRDEFSALRRCVRMGYLA